MDPIIAAVRNIALPYTFPSEGERRMACRGKIGTGVVHALGVLLCCGSAAGVHAATTATEQAPRSAESERAGLRVQQVRPGLNVVAGAGGNVVVWSGDDGVTLVDSGLAAQSGDLFETVARIAPGSLRFVVNTHGHADHTGGNEAAARKGATVIGHESLREYAGRDPAVPAGAGEGAALGALPVITTTGSLALNLNDDRLDVFHVADAHTSADMVARWARADVVALGDIYWNGQYPFIDREAGGSLAGLVAAVEAVLARSTSRTVIVPGHGPVSNRAELAAYRDMLVAVGRKVREAIEQGQLIDEILAARPTAEFDARFARPGAFVAPEDFVRNLYADLTRARSTR
jgi:glyoxylase-like metal-dependent hydrolase (beta-lactamase superfamily II)